MVEALYVDRMVEALEATAVGLEGRGDAARAARVHQIAARVRDLPTASEYDTDLAVIDEVLRAGESLDGELLGALVSVAQAHGPGLTEKLHERGGDHLARVLALSVALPDSPDRRRLGDEADVLAEMIRFPEGRAPSEVLWEAEELTRTAGARSTHGLVVSLRAKPKDPRPAQRRLDRAVPKATQAMTYGDVLRWVLALAAIVSTLIAVTGMVQQFLEGAERAAGTAERTLRAFQGLRGQRQHGQR